MAPVVSRMRRCEGLGLGYSSSWVRDSNGRHPGLCVAVRQAVSWQEQGSTWGSMNQSAGTQTRRGQRIQGASDFQQFHCTT